MRIKFSNTTEFNKTLISIRNLKKEKEQRMRVLKKCYIEVATTNKKLAAKILEQQKSLLKEIRTIDNTYNQLNQIERFAKGGKYEHNSK